MNSFDVFDQFLRQMLCLIVYMLFIVRCYVVAPMYDHCNITGHKISLYNISIVGREDWNLIRTTDEALYIRVNNPSLNKNIGKYCLPHIWYEILFNTSKLPFQML